MDEHERQRLLDRVNSHSATVGATIPETVTIHGDELPLSEFLIETRAVDRVPPEAEETLAEAKRVLREERARRIERLETETLTLETAEEIAEEAIGIRRALDALENIRRPDFGERSSRASVDDHRRWLGFLDTVRE
jgi:hypothetical protein